MPNDQRTPDDASAFDTAMAGAQGLIGRVLGWGVGGILGVVGAVTTISELIHHHHGIGPYLLAGGFLLMFLAALDMWRAERAKARALKGQVTKMEAQVGSLQDDVRHLARERDHWLRTALTPGASETSSPAADTNVEPSLIVTTTGTTTGGTGTPPKTPDRRALLRKCLLDFQSRGEYILRLPNIDRVVEEAPKWQNEVYDFLDGVLADSMQAQLFAQHSTPIADQPVALGLNQRIGSQVVFLRDMIQNRIDGLEIKDSWQPV
jgi:hypothetical protein